MVSLPGNTPYMCLWLCMQVVLCQFMYPEMYPYVSSSFLPICRGFHGDLANIYRKYMWHLDWFPAHSNRTCSIKLSGLFSSTLTVEYSFYMFYMIYHEVTWAENDLNSVQNNIQWPITPKTVLLVPILTQGDFRWSIFIDHLPNTISTWYKYYPVIIYHGYIQGGPAPMCSSSPPCLFSVLWGHMAIYSRPDGCSMLHRCYDIHPTKKEQNWTAK